MFDHLFEIGRDQDHPMPFVTETADRLKDFLLGARSMPLVGSSSRSIFGFRFSHFPSTKLSVGFLPTG